VKLRREERGHHFYERSSGVHILLDEAPVEFALCDIGPELVSIALLNPCDLRCPFCYAPKTQHRLEPEFVLDACKQFAALGTLEVAFGGGEPTLYPGLSDLSRRIWVETDLGISITTHGHHLTDRLIDELTGYVSIIRVSIDGPEPIYSALRARPLADLLRKLFRTAKQIPLGINTVVNSTTMPLLDEMAAIVREVGAVDWLLLPKTKGGAFTLSQAEWQATDRWIGDHCEQIPLRVTAEAVRYLSGPFPLISEPHDYAHIRADGTLCRCSYGGNGVMLRGQPIAEALGELARLR
jgi:sulfatase maturation enzyme AslB (radical SAM superfamily)